MILRWLGLGMPAIALWVMGTASPAADGALDFGWQPPGPRQRRLPPPLQDWTRDSLPPLDLFRNNKEVENGVVGNCFHCDEPELLQPANSLDARASTGG
jgi:hypothetical protein